MNKNDYQLEGELEMNAGIFDNIVGYGNGVSDRRDTEMQGIGQLPGLETPGDGEQLTNMKGVDITRQEIDPEINVLNGRSRNYNLEQLRNQHPFLTIDPPLITSAVYNMLFSDPETVIAVPDQAQMYRITFQSIAIATAILAVSHQRGVAALLPTTSGVYSGLIFNPTNNWRFCKGVKEVCMANVGTANRVLVCVEFFVQL